MLFQEMLLDFFIYETLLGHCGFKIAVVEFVYPVLFFFKETVLSFGSNYSFQISIQFAIMFESVTKLAIKALAKSTKCENNILSLLDFP